MEKKLNRKRWESGEENRRGDKKRGRKKKEANYGEEA